MTRDLIVVQVDRARALLALAKDAPAAKRVADMAHAAEIYARRQKLSQEAIDYAHAVKIDATTLLGQFLLKTQKNKGAKGNPGGRGNRNVQCSTGTAQPPTLASAGITKKESTRQNSGAWHSECIYVPRLVVMDKMGQWSNGTLPRSGRNGGS